MSSWAMCAALYSAPPELSCEEKFVLVVLSDRVHDNLGQVHFSVPRVAHLVRLPVERVREILARFCEVGVLAPSEYRSPLVDPDLDVYDWRLWGDGPSEAIPA